MKKEILRWLEKEHNFFVECHQGSEPLIWFLRSFFMYGLSEKYGEFSYLLEQASLGHGVNTIAAGYMLENDADGGDIVEGAEFFFSEQFDGQVDISTYITVLELVSSAYVKFYPEERENILALLEKVKSRYKVR